MKVSSTEGAKFINVEGFPAGSAQRTSLALTCKNPASKWEILIELTRDLHRESDDIRDIGVPVLHEILLRTSTLRKIDLRGNGITHAGAALLLEGLRLNSNILQLSIQDEDETDDFIKEARRHEKDIQHFEVGQDGSILYSTLKRKPGVTFCTVITCLAACVMINGQEYITSPEPGNAKALLEKQALIDRRALLDVIQVINIRCLFNRSGAVKAIPPIRNWPYYAAIALWDKDEINIPFATIFDEQIENATKFINYLMTIMIGINKNTHPKKPKLPGALIAAARHGKGVLTACLINHLGCEQEPDEFGELPALKFLRRASEDGLDKPFYVWVTNNNMIANPSDDRTLRQAVENARLNPRSWWLRSATLTDNVSWWSPKPRSDVYWKLKNFGLEMVRLTEFKPGSFIDEVISSAAMRRKDTITCVTDKVLCDLATQLVTCVTEGNTELRTTPVWRIRTTLLAYKLFVSTPLELDSWIRSVSEIDENINDKEDSVSKNEDENINDKEDCVSKNEDENEGKVEEDKKSETDKDCEENNILPHLSKNIARNRKGLAAESRFTGRRFFKDIVNFVYDLLPTHEDTKLRCKEDEIEHIKGKRALRKIMEEAGIQVEGQVPLIEEECNYLCNEVLWKWLPKVGCMKKFWSHKAFEVVSGTEKQDSGCYDIDMESKQLRCGNYEARIITKGEELRIITKFIFAKETWQSLESEEPRGAQRTDKYENLLFSDEWNEEEDGKWDDKNTAQVYNLHSNEINLIIVLY